MPWCLRSRSKHATRYFNGRDFTRQLDLEKDAMVLKEQELVRDSILQWERLRETAQLEKDAMVLKAQEQALKRESRQS